MTSDQLHELSKEDLIQKVLELESVLNEFQESSKDLERALEEELQDLENKNTQISSQLNTKKEELSQANAKIITLTSELNTLHDTTTTKIHEKDKLIHHLTSQLVKTEIINDSMENDERVKNSKFEVQLRFNNELLERLAMLESDYEREKKMNVEKQLYITNYQNQIKDLNRKIECLESNGVGNDTYHGDVSMLSIKEMLKSTPPPNKIRESAAAAGQSNIKKSDSLKKLRSLTMDIEAFLGSLTSANKSRTPSPPSSVLKSSSTTQLSTANTTNRSHNSAKDATKRLSYSKRFSDLPSIKGSPTPSKRSNIEKSKSTKQLNI